MPLTFDLTRVSVWSVGLGSGKSAHRTKLIAADPRDAGTGDIECRPRLGGRFDSIGERRREMGREMGRGEFG